MACCDWDTFSDGISAAFKRANIGLALIDWKRAKRHWKKYHCTGAEAAHMQIQDLRREGEYLFSVQEYRRIDDDEDGGVNVFRPSPIPA